MSQPASTPLSYTIAHSTPHSGKYVPENILVDKPQDQSSRWSGAFLGSAKQWILLRLESLAVLKSITFGKFSKQHPCNMKEFKLFVGMTEDNMTEVLHSGLKNDAVPETFAIKHTNSAGVAFPTRYVKIVPICAHGQSFHVSIWHVSMTGTTNPPIVERIRVDYAEHRETSVLRHILKHLRQRRLLTPFHSILSRTNLRLEHPLITQLHSSIVLKGDWSAAEDLLSSISSAGLFENYLYACQPHAIWTRLIGTDADGDVPPPRGGHAMCMDPVNEMIYLFGGWNGEKSLDDFWAYSVREDKWRVLSHSTSGEQNAPGARSCHKMVFDTKTGSIYLLGRLNDSDGLRASVTVAPVTVAHSHPQSGPPATPQQQQRQPTVVNAGEANGAAAAGKTYCSEFYRYHTRGADKGKWDFLSFDTLSSGGPPLIFDHQMVMDCETQIMYVFGGRVVDGDWDTSKYSGLYSYNVRLSKWRLLQQADTTSSSSQVVIPSRFGHSMVLEPTSKTLFIFAGQREERYLSDMYAYNINTNTASELFSNFTAAGGPDACFTQRAVIDPVLKEIYVFCGLTRDSASGTQNTTLRSYLSNWVYRYDTCPGKWAEIMRHPETTAGEIPMPRFAHQVVYDPATRCVFLHGGNAGGLSAAGVGGGGSADGDGGDGDGKEKEREGGKEKRLDDFWRMELRRPGPEEIIRKAKFLIRRQQFREMCEDSAPVKALQFLQTEVSSVVDHKNAKETELFRSLLTHLLSLPPPLSPEAPPPKMVRRPSSESSESTGSESTNTSLRERSTRPRKRSRGSGSGSGSVNWGWTNELGLEDELDEAEAGNREIDIRPSSDRVSVQALRGVPDPIEGPAGEQLSAERYAQRTEVFEGLLEFVGDGEGEKQPLESLLDFVERGVVR